jgi:peptide-methionine (S)-S-oxide reductase
LERIKGVKSTVAGYISSGEGKTEAVQVLFDPAVLSYRQLLDAFFSFHDPTAVRKVKYRSLIAFHDPFQEKAALQTVAAKAAALNKPVQTVIEPSLYFEIAEEKHQHYYTKSPEKAYCQRVIHPKILRFRGNL